jgi:hypothetical protein
VESLVFLEDEHVNCRLAKDSAVGLYCWCRQAERSIDFALTGGSAQWSKFTEYYDDRKRAGMASALEELKALGVHLLNPPAHEKVAYLSLWSPFLYLLKRMRNRSRAAWVFSKEELAFIYSVLDKFFRTLDSRAKPDQEFLIQLRMRLYDCQWIIGKHLCGLPELARAAYVEHFCQAPQLTPVTLEEMGIRLPPALRRPLPQTGRVRTP